MSSSNLRQIKEHQKSPHVTQEFVKNTNVYDLINITLKASDNKLSFMDRYIQRATERASIQDQNSEVRDQLSGEFNLINASRDSARPKKTSSKNISNCSSKEGSPCKENLSHKGLSRHQEAMEELMKTQREVERLMEKYQ